MKTLAFLSITCLPMLGQTAASLSPTPNLQFFNTSTGASIPCVGCSLYTYSAGTLTPLATYVDYTGTTTNANPIVLDSGGYSPSGIWIKGSCYKFILQDVSAVTIWTQDQICDNAQLFKAALAASGGAALVGFLPTSGTVATTVAAALNDAFLLDIGYTTFAAACSAAVGASKTLAVTKAWTALGNQTCTANLMFFTGGTLQPSNTRTVTLSGTISASAIKIFDVSLGGNTALSSPPSLAPIEWWGGVGDNSTDNASPLTHAETSVCGGSNKGSIMFGNATYKFVTFPNYTGQYCSLLGTNRGGSIISVAPSAGSTDGVQFVHSGTGQFANRVAHMTITAANTNVRRLVSLGAQEDFSMEDVTLNGQNAVNALYMVGMQTSSFHHVLIGGPNSGTNDAVLVDSSPISTTVVFDSESDIEGATGACLHAKGSSSAASITFSDSTAENCKYAIEAETNVVLHHNHFEHSNTTTYYIPGGSSALIQSDNNNIQQCVAVGGTFFTLSTGATMYSSNDVTDLADGCTLYAAPTGARVYTAGPQFPYGAFPEGVLNSGDASALASGVLASTCYSATGVNGAFTVQLFRGNCYILSIAGGTTTIHIEGGATGGATAKGLPPHERITLFLVSDGDTVQTGGGNSGDFPIIGAINDQGRQGNAGYYQVMILESDASGNFQVVSSPGWHSTSAGVNYPSSNMPTSCAGKPTGSLASVTGTVTVCP